MYKMCVKETNSQQDLYNFLNIFVKAHMAVFFSQYSPSRLISTQIELHKNNNLIMLYLDVIFCVHRTGNLLNLSCLTTDA